MNEIIVQKFGGTSVGSVERIDAVAEIIKKASKSQKLLWSFLLWVEKRIGLLI
jgi:aspartokinase